MTYPVKECPECDGEGRIEVLNGYQSPTAIEPATHMEYCDTCRGSGRVEYEWVDVEDGLPPVGVPVLVRGLQDGAPDAVEAITEDVLLDPGDGEFYSAAYLPTWKHCVRASEWASL